MQRLLWPLPIFCYALFTLCLAGCEAIPVSQHPLSDETTSQIDEELLGMWDIINEPEEGKPAPAAKEVAEESTPVEAVVDEERPPRFAIGKLAGKERVHEVAGMSLDDSGQINVNRFPIYTTRLGEQRFISLRVGPSVDNSDFFIARYTLVNANRGLLYPLDRDVITAAIGRGELKGVVKKAASDDPNAEPRKESIRITASAEELQAFLVKHEKKAFSAKPMYRLQRAAGN
ncbi:hypothetical protein NA78x_000493 [Anatilimnocola sp. NA78]|uniref:hypothetical protein n=1 Tax=Anatilimnocola sp. NA78 TaxID=3415683 RepID=UPI003CE4DE53